VGVETYACTSASKCINMNMYMHSDLHVDVCMSVYSCIDLYASCIDLYASRIDLYAHIVTIRCT